MSNDQSTKTAVPNKNDAAIALILAWGFVGLPLAWGVVQTIRNALKLFQ